MLHRPVLRAERQVLVAETSVAPTQSSQCDNGVGERVGETDGETDGEPVGEVEGDSVGESVHSFSCKTLNTPRSRQERIEVSNCISYVQLHGHSE